MNTFRLRPAEKSDQRKIRALIHKVGINPMDLNWRHFVVVENQGGEFIGCGQLKPHRDGSVELASLAVENTYQGQGVGRLLIEHLTTRGPRPLYLMCRPELGVLYEKFGFEVVAGEEMPPYFRRIMRFTRLLGAGGPLVMKVK